MSTKKLTTEDFKNRSILKHEGKYTYPNVKYTNIYTSVCITCPIHGDFWQLPKVHLSGSGCRKCHDEAMADQRKKTDSQFIEESIKIQGGKYTYPKVVYVNGITKVCITCPIHGDFWQTPRSHLNGAGCPTCSKVARVTNEYIDSKISNKKIARLTDFKTGKKMTWKCLKPKCNHIWTTGHSGVIKDKGCPRCNLSKGNSKLVQIAEKHNLLFKIEKTFDDCRNPKTGRKLKFDMCVFNHGEDIRCLIEFDGQQHEKPYLFKRWYKDQKAADSAFESQKFRDLIKNEYCKSKNINLIRINHKDMNRMEEILSELGVLR